MQIRITSTIPGFRRAGIAHPAGPETYPADRFTNEQLAQLQAEPRLLVEILEGDDSAGDSQTAADQSPAGVLDDDVLGQLLTHIASLDTNDATLWNQDGSPKAKTYPEGTTAEQRNAAWAEFQKRQAVIEKADQAEAE